MADKWIQSAVSRMKRKGTVGALGRAAKRAGFSSALAYARHILAHKSQYSPLMRRRAQFAVNAAKAAKKRVRRPSGR